MWWLLLLLLLLLFICPICSSNGDSRNCDERKTEKLVERKEFGKFDYLWLMKNVMVCFNLNVYMASWKVLSTNVVQGRKMVGHSLSYHWLHPWMLTTILTGRLWSQLPGALKFLSNSCEKICSSRLWSIASSKIQGNGKKDPLPALGFSKETITQFQCQFSI